MEVSATVPVAFYPEMCPDVLCHYTALNPESSLSPNPGEPQSQKAKAKDKT